jgi:hypothetical protein
LLLLLLLLFRCCFCYIVVLVVVVIIVVVTVCCCCFVPVVVVVVIFVVVVAFASNVLKFNQRKSIEIINHFSSKVVPSDFWSESLFNTILSCMLEPGTVGFNVGDVEVIEHLPEQVRQIEILYVKFTK